MKGENKMVTNIDATTENGYNIGLLREKPLFLKTQSEVIAFLNGKMN